VLAKKFCFTDPVNDAEELAVDLISLPAGTWVRELGGGFEVGNSTHSPAQFSLAF